MFFNNLPLPKDYICYRATESIQIDGSMREPSWKMAPWTDDFVDIVGESKPKPRFRTRAKLLWDDQNLYVGAELEEPNVWGTQTVHDSVIFRDNDFEIFVDPDNDGCFYTEFEMNALNTTWDLLLPRSYRGGGPPIDGFELKGIRTAVQVDGTVNNALLGSKGWRVEVAIPWSAFKDVTRTALPPHDRDQWRIDFSRVEWKVSTLGDQYVKLKGLPEDNWVWSPIGVVDMHRPEQWGILQFSRLSGGHVDVDASPGFRERRILVDAWEAMHQFRRTHERWAATAAELGILDSPVKVYSGLAHFELELNGFVLDDSLRFTKMK